MLMVQILTPKVPVQFLAVVAYLTLGPQKDLGEQEVEISALHMSETVRGKGTLKNFFKTTENLYPLIQRD